MNEKMENAVRAVLKSDPEYDPLKADRAVAVLKGRSVSALREVDKFDHVVPRQEAANLLRVHVRTVDNFVRRGLLRSVPGSGSRSLGISAVSLKAYLEKRAQVELGGVR